MSKIKIVLNLKSKNNKYNYEGKGIKNNGKIIFKDDNTTTVITLKPDIIIERKNENYMKLGFKTNKIVQGTYNTAVGKINIKTKTIKIINKQNNFEIEYFLIIDDLIEKFLLNFSYTIDSE